MISDYFKPTLTKTTSVYTFFVTLLISVFFAEFLVMMILSSVDNSLSPLTEAVLDGFLLSALLSPVLFFLVVRPLLAHIRARIKFELTLMRQNKSHQAVSEMLEESHLSDDASHLAGNFLKLLMVQTDSHDGLIALVTPKQTMDIIAFSEHSLFHESPENFVDLPIDDGWMMPAIERETLIANSSENVREELGLPGWYPAAQSILVVPLMRAANVFGIVMLSKKYATFRDVDKQLTESLAPFITTIIQRKLAETRIRTDEERLQIVNLAAIDAIITIDETGCVSNWNPAAVRMFGYSREEIIGKDLHQLLAPSRYWTDIAKDLAGFKKTGRGRFVNKYVKAIALKKNGQEFPIELSISPFPTNQGWGAVAIARDRSQMEEFTFVDSSSL